MLGRIRAFLFKPIKLRFLLPLIYLLLILLAQLSRLIPSLNECSIYLEEFPGDCFRVSDLLVKQLWFPVFDTLSQFYDSFFFIGLIFKFFDSLCGYNPLTGSNWPCFIIAIYGITLLLTYLFGLIVDKTAFVFYKIFFKKRA